MSSLVSPARADVASLLNELKAYCFPHGEQAAIGVRGIRAAQRGEIRSSPDARWNPFEAQEFVDASTSAFRWEARMGTGLFSVRVIDAFESGHGRLALMKGPIALKTMDGPDVDKGELQRYLGYVSYCPPMLINNPWLDFAASGPRTLRLADRRHGNDTSVEIDIAPDGCPGTIRAVRPMTVGRRAVPTSWSAAGSDAHEWDGFRVARRLEASWHPPEGSFVYIRIELTAFTVLR